MNFSEIIELFIKDNGLEAYSRIFSVGKREDGQYPGKDSINFYWEILFELPEAFPGAPTIARAYILDVPGAVFHYPALL